MAEDGGTDLRVHLVTSHGWSPAAVLAVRTTEGLSELHKASRGHGEPGAPARPEHPGKDLPELRWAPYQEFGSPDPAQESSSAPAGPVLVGSTGYRGKDVIVYWYRQPDPFLKRLDERIRQLWGQHWNDQASHSAKVSGLVEARNTYTNPGERRTFRQGLDAALGEGTR